MAAVVVTLSGHLVALPGRRQAVLSLLGSGQALALPITDPAAVYASLEGNWVEVPRPGRKPMNVRVGGKLSTLQLNITLAPANGSVFDPGGTVQPVLERLINFANADGVYPLALAWGGVDGYTGLSATGHWRIDALTVNSTQRQPGTNNVTQANVSLTLKEVSDPPRGI
jgi:hypothetical protein